MDTIDWLLDSDPAVSWQAMRDLTDASPAAVAAERGRVAREGIGAEILVRQGPDGSWHRTDAPDWLPTLFTLLLLRSTGVDRAESAVDSAVARPEAGFRWDEEFGAKQFFEGEDHASTAARSRLAPTSGGRRKASRAVSSASSSRTVVGTAKRRRARARRSIPRVEYTPGVARAPLVRATTVTAVRFPRSSM